MNNLENENLENAKQGKQDDLQELQEKAKVPITRRKLDLFIAIMLILTALSTILFALAEAPSDLGFAFMIVAMFSPAYIYVAIIVILLVKDKKKLFWIHLIFLFLLNIAWGTASFFIIILGAFWGSSMLLASGIVGITLSIVTTTLLIIYFIKLPKNRSKNHEN